MAQPTKYEPATFLYPTLGPSMDGPYEKLVLDLRDALNTFPEGMSLKGLAEALERHLDPIIEAKVRSIPAE